jgi:hypothetical protein
LRVVEEGPDVEAHLGRLRPRRDGRGRRPILTFDQLGRCLDESPKLAEKLFSDPDETADPPFGFTQLTSRFGEGLLAFRSEDPVLVQRTLERRSGLVDASLDVRERTLDVSALISKDAASKLCWTRFGAV